MRRHWPLVGALLAACLFVAAAARYPGGTTTSADSIGYDWTRNFISSLFASTALNGSPNPARYVAMAAMLVLCVSIGAVFRSISRTVGSKPERRAIEITGIPSMVYAFLVVTPMHDLMVSIALALFVVAMLAILRVLSIERARRLWLAGVSSLVLLIVTAVVYYGGVLYALLPMLQKASFVACASWLFAVYYDARRGEARPSAAPDQAMEATR
jgi:hypothetical protein